MSTAPPPQQPPAKVPAVNTPYSWWWMLASAVVFALLALWVLGLAQENLISNQDAAYHAGKGLLYDPKPAQVVNGIRLCAFFLMFIAAAAIKYLFTSPRRG